jgi:hypothetical protein
VEGTPFIVGVTGHRDIDPVDMDRAKSAIRNFLEDLRARLPDTTVILMSGCADGADRLAARCALELGIPVHAVLPMDRAEYENDFSNDSASDFRQLLDQEDVEITEMPTVLTGTDIDRNACYRQLTDSLIRKSNLLLAIWDGVDTGLVAGTSDTVLSYLSDSRQVGPLSIVTEVPVAVNAHENVFWVHVQRSGREPSGEYPAGNAGVFLAGVADTGVIVMQDDMPESLCEQLAQINSYHADYSSICKRSGAPQTWGLPDIPEHYREADPEGLLDHIEQAFERADGLASYYQLRSDRLFKVFSLVAGVLGLLFLIYAKLVASNTFLYAYVALFAGGFLAFRIAGSKKWFAKHIMYRVVAETMRIKFFLRIARADDRVAVGKIARQAGIYKFSGFSWIGHLFKGAEPVLNSQVSTQVSGAHLDEARRLWVADQSAYFGKKIRSMHHKHHRVERIKQFLLGATVVGIVVLILFKYPLMNEIPGTELQYKKLIVFFMGLFPFWLGVWEIYHNKMATKELLWQYRNQGEAFALTDFQMGHAGSIEQQREILAHLASDALFENYLWTIQRFHREHEPPAAG